MSTSIHRTVSQGESTTNPGTLPKPPLSAERAVEFSRPEQSLIELLKRRDTLRVPLILEGALQQLSSLGIDGCAELMAKLCKSIDSEGFRCLGIYLTTFAEKDNIARILPPFVGTFIRAIQHDAYPIPATLVWPALSCLDPQGKQIEIARQVAESLFADPHYSIRDKQAILLVAVAQYPAYREEVFREAVTCPPEQVPWALLAVGAIPFDEPAFAAAVFSIAASSPYPAVIARAVNTFSEYLQQERALSPTYVVAPEYLDLVNSGVLEPIILAHPEPAARVEAFELWRAIDPGSEKLKACVARSDDSDFRVATLPDIGKLSLKDLEYLLGRLQAFTEGKANLAEARAAVSGLLTFGESVLPFLDKFAAHPELEYHIVTGVQSFDLRKTMLLVGVMTRARPNVEVVPGITAAYSQLVGLSVRALPAWEELLAGELSDDTRACLVSFLAYCNEGALPLITDALASESGKVRSAALTALGDIPYEPGGPWISALDRGIVDPDPLVRSSAVRGIRKLGYLPASTANLLAQAIKMEADPELRAGMQQLRDTLDPKSFWKMHTWFGR